MTKSMCGLLAVALLSLTVASGFAQDDKDSMVENPKYKFWANSKPGATSTYNETTKLFGAEKSSVPGGVDQKTITYRLVSVDKDKAVVLATVVEEDFLGTVESAPTKHTYPAKVKKANLDAFFQEWNVKEGEDETIKVGDKEIKCKVRAGSQKIEGGTVEFKICYSDTVPGGFVKRTRTTKEGDKKVAETTILLTSWGEAKKDKD
jgi:hypothetical protein